MSHKIYPQILLLGDSIVQFASYQRDGFSLISALEEHCARRLDVVNRGLSGYNTSNAMKILPDLIPSPSYAKVDYLLIMFGANDAALPESPWHQHVSQESYNKNLRDIINHPSIFAHKPTILLTTPPPVNEIHLEAETLKRGLPKLDRYLRVTASYAEIVRNIAGDLKDQKVVLIDLWSAIIDKAISLQDGAWEINREMIGTREHGDDPGLRVLLADGLHLTAEGYKVFSDELLKMVGPEWSSEPPNEPSWIWPHWSNAPKLEAETSIKI